MGIQDLYHFVLRPNVIGKVVFVHGCIHINDFFFFSSRRRHTRSKRDWSSDVCSSDLSAMDLGSGPLLKAVLFVFGHGRRPYLFLAAHHLVIDGVSWRILLDDLDRAYQQTEIGRASCRERVGVWAVDVGLKIEVERCVW